MGLLNPQVEAEYEQTLGVDNTSNEASVPPGYVRDTWNANVGLSGGYVKRDGHSNSLNSAWGSRSITAGIEFRTPTVTARQILFGTDGTSSGGTIGQVSAGAVSSIKTNLSGTARPSFVQLKGLLLFTNGVDDPVIYDGSSTRQFGITRPASAPTGFAQTTGGSLNTLGSYLFAYTYYNSVTGAESSPSDLSAIQTLTGSNNKFTFTVAAGSSSTADTIRIWRTFGDGNQLFLEQEVAISTTSIISTIADSGLDSTQLELDNSRVTDFEPLVSPFTAQYPCVAQNRVFLKTDRNEIRHSKIGQAGPMFESFEASAVANTKGTFGDRDDVIGTGVAGDTPIIIKERSIGRLDAVGVNADLSPFDQVRYQYREISNTIGGVSHWAGTQVFGEWVFLGHDNVYATNGQSIRPIGDRIASFVKSCGFLSTQVVRLSAENDVRNWRIVISVFASGLSAAPDYQIIGDYRKYPDFRWTFYRPGTNSSTHPGIRPGCFFLTQNAADGGYDLYAGNIDANGQLYKLNDGSSSDRGSAIYYRVKTRAYAMGQPLADKLYKMAGFHAKGNGNNYNLSVSAIYDLSGSSEDVQLISLTGTGALWDVALWDVDAWADDAVQLKEYSAHRKAKFQQLVFENSDLNAPVEVLGWASSASMFGLYG
jgi:hypothetical protein